MAPIHDLMPGILPEEGRNTWLATVIRPEVLKELLVTYWEKFWEGIPHWYCCRECEERWARTHLSMLA